MHILGTVGQYVSGTLRHIAAVAAMAGASHSSHCSHGRVHTSLHTPLGHVMSASLAQICTFGKLGLHMTNQPCAVFTLLDDDDEDVLEGKKDDGPEGGGKGDILAYAVSQLQQEVA